MQTLAIDFLTAVVGGGESTTTTTGTVKTLGVEGTVRNQSTITDNESCRRDVKAACDSMNSGFWGVDRAKSGQCFIENFPKCPPSP